MSQLGLFLSSEVRAEILNLLFDGRGHALHLRDLHRRTSFALRTVQTELVHLKNLDLVNSRKDGNRVYYEANTSHPLFELIIQFVERTSGIPERLREIFSNIEGVEISFIYGSFAKGSIKARSDIDLMIIGNAGLRTLIPKLNAAGEAIGREINPHIISRRNWRQKIAVGDHFFKSVLNEPKIFIVGDEDELS